MENPILMSDLIFALFFVVYVWSAAISEDDNESKAIHTFHKSQRFSRKLKRRLTQRTLAEARALKKQSKEAIHILIYAAELVFGLCYTLAFC